MKQSQTSTVAIATRLAIALAVLPGGWDRAAVAAPELCVLAPHVTPANSPPPSLPTALVPLRRPTLFVREPLAELRLEGGDTPPWRFAPPRGSALEGPLAWPLPPLQAHQHLTLRLRPLGAEPNQFATIRLQAAPAQRLEVGEALLRSLLSGPPTAWRPTIDGLLAKGDRALATALLFASEGPNDPALNALRLWAARESCR
jgi:hypothetical protein